MTATEKMIAAQRHRYAAESLRRAAEFEQLAGEPDVAATKAVAALEELGLAMRLEREASSGLYT